MGADRWRDAWVRELAGFADALFPRACRLCGGAAPDDFACSEHSLPPAELLARHADLFADPRVKELDLSPKGLRIVILAEEADRGRYLIFREAEMGMTPLDPDRVAPLLDRLRDLRKDVMALKEGQT